MTLAEECRRVELIKVVPGHTHARAFICSCFAYFRPNYASTFSWRAAQTRPLPFREAKGPHGLRYKGGCVCVFVRVMLGVLSGFLRGYMWFCLKCRGGGFAVDIVESNVWEFLKLRCLPGNVCGSLKWAGASRQILMFRGAVVFEFCLRYEIEFMLKIGWILLGWKLNYFKYV